MVREGSSTECMEIETAADTLDASVIFHLINDIMGFVLYMHQQIPSVMPDIAAEFDTLNAEYKELEMDLTQSELKATCRRKHNGRMREIRQGTKRLEKLMKVVASFQTALKLMISEVPYVQEAILVVGSSPRRPQYVYEVCFLHSIVMLSCGNDFIKSKSAEVLSRKAIRTLISKGAGTVSYPGPMRLFLLVKAPSSLSLPLHFLPKRDFGYSKKVLPYRLQVKCRTQCQEMDPPDHDIQPGNFIVSDSCINDLIWFQCRHVIKGLAFSTPEEE